MMTNEIFNEEAFFGHLGGDRELGLEILNVYIVDAPERFGALEKAFDANDLTLIIKYSHALKGISATIRAGKVAQLSECVEVAARKGDLNESRKCLLDIKAELGKTLEVLNDYLKS